MSSTSQKRKKIQKKFKNRGYNLKFDALDEILVFADQFPDDADGEAIDLLLDNLQESRMWPDLFLSRIILRRIIDSEVSWGFVKNDADKSSTVDAESVRGLINQLLGAHNAPEEPTTSASSLAVIDAFLVPKFGYDSVKKKFNE